MMLSDWCVAVPQLNRNRKKLEFRIRFLINLMYIIICIDSCLSIFYFSILRRNKCHNAKNMLQKTVVTSFEKNVSKYMKMWIDTKQTRKKCVSMFEMLWLFTVLSDWSFFDTTTSSAWNFRLCLELHFLSPLRSVSQWLILQLFMKQWLHSFWVGWY